MKIKSIITAIVLIVFFINCNAQNEKKEINFSELSGPYLGQKPPGITPELFAPNIISRKDYFEHSAAIFSPDMKEVYWSGKPNGTRYFEINVMKEINGIWTEQVITFSHKEYSFSNPVFSPDGNKLFFDSRADIWFVERKGDNWSVAVKVSSLINTDGSEAILSITDDGSIYFLRYNANASREGRKHEMYVSRKIDGNYTEPVKLGKIINSDDQRECGLFVAPDESYLILESVKDNRSSDLFICYKMKDASWSKRINLNLGWARFPSISPDGKYLFYMSREGINWVSTLFIEELRPKNLK